MTQKMVKLSTREIELLISLASDQLFRREFIDPKMPGHISKPEDITQGKALINRLKGILEQDGARGTPPTRKP
ncbi:hypothetical protein [uncultured Paludibaculum sp.]|uniref:hypothetical protein n=1 Tax=uncultured Paludibaculum sp. TaxID=1765020 RepID=UPI002AAA82B8|nr:hypothetical protein [uncultured Paludibaculum sp.]